MQKYQNIKKINIQNFRNLGNVTLDFSDTPIISLIGENESGKTSIVKAFGVCAKHIDYRGQKDYIRDGTNEFYIEIELADGTRIGRKKNINSSNNKYGIIYPDGKQKVFDKLDDNIPPEVQELMGLISEPETGELLHIRTYENQLLFVVTRASVNYKVMYDALKISQITRAIKVGSTEANSLKSKISATDNSIGTLQRSLNGVKIYDMEPLLNIKDVLSSELEKLKKFERIEQLINEIKTQKSSLGALKILEESKITEIDTLEVEKFNRIGTLISDIKQMRNQLQSSYELNNLEQVDAGIIEKLDNTVEKMNNISEMKNKLGSMMDLDRVCPISEIEVSTLDRIVDLINNINQQRKRFEIYNREDINTIDESEIEAISKMTQAINLIDGIDKGKTSLISMNDYIDKVLAWMKSIGVATADCPKCGESIIIDMNVLNS